MATDKPRFTITLDDDTYAEVIAYKDKHGLATQSKAIRQLVEIGLDSLIKEVRREDPIVQKIKSLDERGRRVVEAVIDAQSTIDLNEYRMVARSGHKLAPDQMEDARKVIEAMEE